MGYKIDMTGQKFGRWTVKGNENYVCRALGSNWQKVY